MIQSQGYILTKNPLRRNGELLVPALAPADGLQDLVVGHDDRDDVEHGRELAEGEHPAEQVLAVVPDEDEQVDVVDGVRAQVEEGEEGGLDDLDLHAEAEPGLPAGGEPVPVRHHRLEHHQEQGDADEVEEVHEQVAVLLVGLHVAVAVHQPAALHHQRQVRPALEHVAENGQEGDQVFEELQLARAVVDEGGPPVKQLALHPEDQKRQDSQQRVQDPDEANEHFFVYALFKVLSLKQEN